MSVAARDAAGREALQRLRSALRWKRAETGGSFFLSVIAIVGGVAALLGGALGVIGTAIGAAIGLMLGALGGWMLSVAVDARQAARALERGNLPRARLGGGRRSPRRGRAPDSSK